MWKRLIHAALESWPSSQSLLVKSIGLKRWTNAISHGVGGGVFQNQFFLNTQEDYEEVLEKSMFENPAQKEDFGLSKDGCKSHLCIQTGRQAD